MTNIPFQILKGQFLIAMPSMVDPSFSETLTLICEHSSSGALGIIINRPSNLVEGDIFQQVGVSGGDLSTRKNNTVYVGGPVARERGFVISTGSTQWESSLHITPDLQLTTSTDVLIAMAEGQGPQQALIALGYAGWGAGQLEHELSENAWLTCDADPTIIFDTPYHLRLNAAAQLLGVNLNLISDQVGHA